MKITPKNKIERKNVLKYLNDRSIKSKSVSKPEFTINAVKNLPFYWHGKSLETPKHNKIFASQWILEDSVVYGTKCNKLFWINVETNKHFQIPLINGISRDKQCPYVEEPSTNFGIHAIKKNPSETLIATGGENVNSVGIYKIPEFHPRFILENYHQDAIFDICWLDDSHLATCSRDSRLGIWNINPDSAKFHAWYNFRTLSTDDMLYNCDIIDNHSYNGCLSDLREYDDNEKNDEIQHYYPCRGKYAKYDNAYFRYDKSYIGVLQQPLNKLSLANTSQRFRAMEYLPATNRLLIATMNSKLYSIDPCCPPENFNDLESYKTVVQEMVSIKQWPSNPHSFAVGGQGRFSIYDSRKKEPSINVLALAQQVGIRSLAFKDSIVSYGTAEGHINFFDLRINRHLTNPLEPSNYVQLNVEGSIEQNLELGRGMIYPQTAIYTHEYDCTGLKLFAAGGPIAACSTGQAACIFQ